MNHLWYPFVAEKEGKLLSFDKNLQKGKKINLRKNNLEHTNLTGSQFPKQISNGSFYENVPFIPVHPLTIRHDF